MDKETLEKLTQLSRIECSEEDQERLLGDLQKVLGYVEQLQEVNTEGVEPCYQVSEGLVCPQREDEVGPTLDREEFLKNSPSHIGGMVRVPTVIT